MSNIYFAGGFMDDPNNPKGERVFQIVKPSGDNELPYLTYSPKGLISTAHHANLYRLSDNGEMAYLADLRQPGLDKTKPVKLTKSQQNALQMAIKAERFFY